MTLVELLVVMGVLSLLASLLLPAIQSAREAARRTKCANGLRQVAFASMNFESAIRSFPAGTKSAEALSWGTTGILLPYLESEPIPTSSLAQSCWEVVVSPTAPQTTRISVPSYACPSDVFAGQSTEFFWWPDVFIPTHSYIGVSGDSSTGENQVMLDGDGMFFAQSQVRAKHVVDGMSKTMLFGERRVQYGSELDLPIWSYCFCGRQTSSQYNPVDVAINEPLCRSCFSSYHPGGCYFAFAAGQVQFLSSNSDLQLLQALATRSGRE